MSDNTPTPEPREKNSQVNKVVSSDHFTPGPWKVSRHDLKNNDSIYLIVDSTDHDIDIVALKSENRNMMDANYQLMAAAPEMLSALRKSNDMIETCLIEAMWSLDVPQEFFETLKQVKKDNDSVIQKATTITE